MNCPNQKIINDRIAQCNILKEFGIDKIPGPKRRGFPCEECKKEWVGEEPPSKDSMTKPMSKILAHGRKMPLPTLTQQSLDYASELSKWAFNGFPSTTEEEFNNRLSICKQNKCGQYIEETNRCSVCGCFLNQAAKIATKDCPLNLWPKLEVKERIITKGCSSCSN